MAPSTCRPRRRRRSCGRAREPAPRARHAIPLPPPRGGREEVAPALSPPLQSLLASLALYAAQPEQALVQLLTGCASASSLFLVASGLSIIFGVTRIVNFAHGSLYMLGAYVAYSLTEALPRSPLGF